MNNKTLREQLLLEFDAAIVAVYGDQCESHEDLKDAFNEFDIDDIVRKLKGYIGG